MIVTNIINDYEKKGISHFGCVNTVDRGVNICAGQYFNYASAYIGAKTTDYHSLIRTIDDTSALV